MTTLNLIESDGLLLYGGTTVGTVDHATGQMTITPTVDVSYPNPLYEHQEVGRRKAGDGSTVIDWRRVLSGFETATVQYQYPPAGADVSASFLPSGSATSAITETVTLDSLDLDITTGYAEQIVRGSARFTLGGNLFVDTAGAIYRDPDPETGVGMLAGTLDPSTGRVQITQWAGGGTNEVTLQALTTIIGAQPVGQVTFRTPLSNIKPGTLQLMWSGLDGTAYSKTPDSSGRIEDSDCLIEVDFTRGVVSARFGLWREVSTLTADELAADWYSAEQIVSIPVDETEVDYIWKPKLADASTITYNAVVSTYLPPDSTLLGLDAARLPPDGQALIYQTGQLALVHHTATKAVSTLSASQVIDCGRTRLYRVAISDSAGAYLGADQYTVDRAAGTVTMSAALDQTGFTAPWTVHHTVADLARITDTDINGTLSLMSALTHDYPADESYCSGVLFAGTLQARVSNIFEQSSWTSVWSDDLIGSAPLASYNSALYPITVNNAGAYKDRILVRFTSATTFDVIGENLGYIGTGNTSTDCEPVNSLTGETYFRIDYRGWGLGWATGNCLRFNLHAAAYPVDLVRAIQPSAPGTGTDCFELMLVGNVDG